MPDLNLNDLTTTIEALSEAKAHLEQALTAASSVAKAAGFETSDPKVQINLNPKTNKG
jgi:hypothetical protein